MEIDGNIRKIQAKGNLAFLINQLWMIMLKDMSQNFIYVNWLVFAVRAPARHALLLYNHWW